MKYISLERASDIINSINEDVFLSVDMTDEKAVVFASTNESHIGVKRDAANYLLNLEENNLRDLFIESENEYENSFVGYYFPVASLGENIGVICIEASIEDIQPYSQIIRRLVRGLVNQYVFNEVQRSKENTLALFLDELFQLTPQSETTLIRDRADIMNIKLGTSRVIAVMHIQDRRKTVPSESDSTEDFGAIIRGIFSTVLRLFDRERNDICVNSMNDLIFLLNVPSSDEALITLKRFNSEIKNRYNVNLYTGVSPVVHDFRELGMNYRYSRIATRVARESRKPFVLYEDLTIDLLLSNVDPLVKKEYVDKVFENCTDAEIREWTNILSVYFEYNGSLTDTADRLFIHKNTLQYKLNGIHSQTGLNPRNRSDSVILYLAVHILSENSTYALS